MNGTHERMKQRVIDACEEALHRQHFVSPIDLFVGTKLLYSGHVEDWKRGKIPYLEEAIQGSFEKRTFCIKCFLDWVRDKGLKPSPTVYLARTSGCAKELRFTQSGDPAIELAYRTHYVSPELSTSEQEKLQRRLEKPPELVVVRIIKNSQCSKCKKELFKGNCFLMEAGEPLCLSCAHMDDLEYLPRGNALLTRRVKKEAKKAAVVVEFSRARKRYERQGILVDKESLEKVQQELAIEPSEDFMA